METMDVGTASFAERLQLKSTGLHERLDAGDDNIYRLLGVEKKNAQRELTSGLITNFSRLQRAPFNAYPTSEMISAAASLLVWCGHLGVSCAVHVPGMLEYNQIRDAIGLIDGKISEQVCYAGSTSQEHSQYTPMQYNTKEYSTAQYKTGNTLRHVTLQHNTYGQTRSTLC